MVRGLWPRTEKSDKPVSWPECYHKQRGSIQSVINTCRSSDQYVVTSQGGAELLARGTQLGKKEVGSLYLCCLTIIQSLKFISFLDSEPVNRSVLLFGTI